MRLAELPRRAGRRRLDSLRAVPLREGTRFYGT